MNYQKYFIGSVQEGNYRELKQVDFFLKRLKPESLCPFVAHTIFPYLFSFEKGSWFRWEKSKDSVVAQCPNSESSLSFRIIRKPTGSIFAEVINQKGECLAGHKKEDVFQLEQIKRESSKSPCCYLNRINSLSFSVVSHSRLCRYYKKPGQAIPFENLVPRDFCLPAYYSAYPYALSLLYDGVDFEKLGREKSACLSCPNDKNHVRMQVRTRRNIFSPLLNFLEKTLRWLGLPKDVLDKSIKIETIGLTGNCSKNLRPGQLFNFNLYNSQELCPAVFYNLFPYLVMLNKKVFPYWTKDRRRIDIHCPDAIAKIIHRISVIGN